MERLRVVAHPPEAFRPRDFARRPAIVDFRSVDEWMRWLANLQADDVEWRPPHWGLGDMTWSVERRGEVLLVGMDIVTAYYPAFIRRQYGLSVVFPVTFSPQSPPAMGRRFLASYRERWASRLKKGPEPSFSVHLPDEYAECMRAEKGKARQRAREKREECKRARRH